MFCPSPPSSGDCPWFGPEMLGPSRSGIAAAVAMAPIGTTTTLQKLTPGMELETDRTAVPCHARSGPTSIPGHWAGPTIREIEMK